MKTLFHILTLAVWLPPGDTMPSPDVSHHPPPSPPHFVELLSNSSSALHQGQTVYQPAPQLSQAGQLKNTQGSTVTYLVPCGVFV